MVLPLGEGPQPASPDDRTVISKQPPLAESPSTPTPPAAKTVAALGEALAGKRLEHYELTEFVGGGGMGVVFRAIDTRLGRTVAVKVLSRDHTDDETIRRFRNEAQSAARLDHPNIARVYYVGEDNGWNFIVFEFIEGINLRQIVSQRGPLPLEDALHYTLQVAEALAHSSSRDVVHRDIKPSNVLVTAADQVKLVDMGLARLHQVESSSDDLTASGVTLGTFDYISPEQARDPRSADVRSDIYSLGCTLYFMLTGQPPFPDGTALQKLLRHNADEPPDVRIFRPDLPPRLWTLLARMLAKRPSQRQQSAADLAAEIVALGQFLGLSKITHRGQVEIKSRPAPGQVRGRAWQIAAAVAILAVAVVLADMYLPAGSPNATALAPPHFTSPRLSPPSPPPSATPVVAPAPATIPPPESTSAVPMPAPRETTNAEPPAVDGSSGGGAAPPLAQVASAGISTPLVEGGLGGEFVEAELSAPLDTPPAASTAPAAPVKISRLQVVLQAPQAPEPEVEYVASLAEACRRAAALGLTEIELAFSGRLLEKPFDVANARLTLTAQPGQKPIVVFQPTAAERQMIRLSGSSNSRLKAQGVEFRLELPQEVASGWSLLAVNTGQSLELFDCVLTVQDENRIQDQAAMIAVQRRRAADMMSMADAQMAMAQSVTIRLERCIARGEATLISMADETKLDLSWQHGLLATSQRLIETGGCDSVTRKVWETITIDLAFVTAYCPQGLYRMERRGGRSNQYAANVSTQNCIFVTLPQSPLFEFVGVRELLPDDLVSSGDRNYFPRPDMKFLRVISDQPGEPPRDFELGDGPSSERRIQVSVPWLRPLRTDVPAHTLTKADFAVEANDAGFAPGQLPDIAPSP